MITAWEEAKIDEKKVKVRTQEQEFNAFVSVDGNEDGRGRGEGLVSTTNAAFLGALCTPLCTSGWITTTCGLLLGLTRRLF